MNKWAMVLVLLVGLAPAAVQAQQTGAPGERIAAAEARLSQAGIPVNLLSTKVAEGRAKGISEERIAAVAERRAAGLLRAQAALTGAGKPIGAGELAAGADALEAGADGPALRAVIQQAREEDAAVALAVLGELVKEGLPVGRALSEVEAALLRGGDALASLPQEAAGARERRGPPEHAAQPASAGRPSGVAGAPAGLPGAGSRPISGTPGGPPAGVPGGRP